MHLSFNQCVTYVLSMDICLDLLFPIDQLVDLDYLIPFPSPKSTKPYALMKPMA